MLLIIKKIYSLLIKLACSFQMNIRNIPNPKKDLNTMYILALHKIVKD